MMDIGVIRKMKMISIIILLIGLVLMGCANDEYFISTNIQTTEGGITNTTANGTANYIPIFYNSTYFVNSQIYENGDDLYIG